MGGLENSNKESQRKVRKWFSSAILWGRASCIQWVIICVRVARPWYPLAWLNRSLHSYGEDIVEMRLTLKPVGILWVLDYTITWGAPANQLKALRKQQQPRLAKGEGILPPDCHWIKNVPSSSARILKFLCCSSSLRFFQTCHNFIPYISVCGCGCVYTVCVQFLWGNSNTDKTKILFPNHLNKLYWHCFGNNKILQTSIHMSFPNWAKHWNMHGLF